MHPVLDTLRKAQVRTCISSILVVILSNVAIVHEPTVGCTIEFNSRPVVCILASPFNFTSKGKIYHTEEGGSTGCWDGTGMPPK
jgi:hypothetical protein